jgi:putative nucleotidyltransferase with HDIG domain
LASAFVALEAFPVLAGSRTRLASVLAQARPVTTEVIAAIESDIALVALVLRLANKTRKSREGVESVADAVDLLPLTTLRGLAGCVRTFDFFEPSGVWGTAPERFRLHALASRRAAERIADAVGAVNRDRLAAASLLHDIGKLVLARAYHGYPETVHQNARTPQERIFRERRELGLDHALVGGVLARRWGLGASLASTIEHHHDPAAEGEAAIIRLADMLAHYEGGTAVSAREMLQGAHTVGLGPDALRQLIYELPATGENERVHGADPNPLTSREYAVLIALAKGSVYNQIAYELAISASTVRSHLHNIYGKLGVTDRAHAVLTATKHGWLPALACAPRTSI